MKIICIVGMPGSGKTEVAKFFGKKSIPIVRMGNVIREEANLRGYEATPETLGRISAGLREEFGEEEIAKRCLVKIDAMNSENAIVIEGIRSLDEVNFFKSKFSGEFYTLAVHSSPKLRFARLRGRGRGDDPKVWAEFKERDLRELGYGMGSAIALADYMVINEGSLDELKKNLEEIFKKLLP